MATPFRIYIYIYIKKILCDSTSGRLDRFEADESCLGGAFKRRKVQRFLLGGVNVSLAHAAQVGETGCPWINNQTWHC